MDALIIFGCIFAPTFVGSMLSAGRDQILFETRPRTRRWVVAALMAVAALLLLAIGLPFAWVLALVLPGPLGSGLGDWVGSGEWIVAKYKVQGFLGRRGSGQD